MLNPFTFIYKQGGENVSGIFWSSYYCIITVFYTVRASKKNGDT